MIKENTLAYKKDGLILEVQKEIAHCKHTFKHIQ